MLESQRTAHGSITGTAYSWVKNSGHGGDGRSWAKSRDDYHNKHRQIKDTCACLALAKENR